MSGSRQRRKPRVGWCTALGKDYVGALREAFEVWAVSPLMSRSQKYESVLRLAEYEQFTVRELALLAGLKVAKVQALLEREEVSHKAAYRLGKFEPSALDALLLMAVSWEDDEFVSPVLARRVNHWGNSIATISALTGIPIEKLREVLHGDLLALRG